jgi:CheY-like chemotaxis protein
MQTFPICQEQAMQPEGNPCLAGDDDKQLRGVSILLVEDNPLNVLVAQTILENRGASVEVASNGQEALDAFDANRHQLILMDLQMPVMDGYRAAKMLRSRGETVPIIALTANMPQEVASDMYACGITDIVVKPFSPENLYRVILNYVDPNIRRAVNQ